MKTIVIGAGPSGLMAALASVKNGEVVIIEKNNRIGRKLMMTGNGRCNVTNNCDVETFLSKVNSNPKFLYRALYAFTPHDMIKWLNEHQVTLKEEDHHRMFPITDKSSTIINTFEKALNDEHVDIHYNEEAQSLIIKDNVCLGIKTDKDTYYADKIILCTGGLSYPVTGSTGDGYKMVNGYHSIIECKPALTGLEISEDWLKTLKGIALKNVELKIKKKKMKGDLLFTHYGISGPMILNLSSILKDKNLTFDLLPDIQDMDKTLQDLFIRYPNKQIQSVLSELLPNRFVEALCQHINLIKPSHSIKKEERQLLSDTLKSFSVTVTNTRGFNEATITKGGIPTKEIDSNTMESKIIKHLFFAGEIMDVDAQTGGYNLQIAWSTGYMAGSYK